LRQKSLVGFLTQERSVQIQCPQCETIFRLDEKRLGENGSQVRCSRCDRVFWAQVPAPEQAAPLEEKIPEELLSAFQEPPRRRIWGIVGFFFLLLLLAVTVRYSYLQLLEPNKEFTEIVQKVFFLNSDPRGTKKIRLQDVKGYFKNHSPEGRFFVVEGRVVNGYGDFRDLIRLRGNLKNAAQQVVATREVEAGWRLDPEELETLSFAEINKLVGGQPERFSPKIRLAPAASAPFMVIFPPSPQPLAEFSVEVIGSQKSSAAAGITH
jgi:predicted Zn finger-like uncharacterized protein